MPSSRRPARTRSRASFHRCRAADNRSYSPPCRVAGTSIVLLRSGNRSGVPLEAPAGRGFIQAPTHDALGADPEELGREVGEPRVDLASAGLVELRLAPDLERASLAVLAGSEGVVEEERDLRVLLGVPPLLSLAERDAADVDRVQLLVEPERHGYDVRMAVRTDGRDPRQRLALQVLDLFFGEDAHPIQPTTARSHRHRIETPCRPR